MDKRFYKQVPEQKTESEAKPPDPSIPKRSPNKDTLIHTPFHLPFLGPDKLGRGAFGTVVADTATIQGGTKKKKKRFAFKTYGKWDPNNGSWGLPPDVSAKNSLRIYLKLRETGIRVFPTYRISEDEKTVLMTLGKQKGWWVYSSNAPEKKRLEKIKAIVNFDDFLQSLSVNLELANQNGITLPKDAYFFLVKKINETEHQADFVIGDLDLVSWVEPKTPNDIQGEIRILENNIEISIILNRFVNSLVYGENRQTYINKIQAKFPVKKCN
jgi:hypothetical protein